MPTRALKLAGDYLQEYSNRIHGCGKFSSSEWQLCFIIRSIPQFWQFINQIINIELMRLQSPRKKPIKRNSGKSKTPNPELKAANDFSIDIINFIFNSSSFLTHNQLHNKFFTICSALFISISAYELNILKRIILSRNILSWNILKWNDFKPNGNEYPMAMKTQWLWKTNSYEVKYS